MQTQGYSRISASVGQGGEDESCSSYTSPSTNDFLFLSPTTTTTTASAAAAATSTAFLYNGGDASCVTTTTITTIRNTPNLETI